MALSSLLVSFGMVLLVLGAMLNLRPRWFGWFGKLPGDIRPQQSGQGIGVPIASALVMLAAISSAVFLFSRFFR